MVELRKRPARAEPAAESRPTKKASTPSLKASAKKAAETVTSKTKAAVGSKSAKPARSAAKEEEQEADVGPKVPAPEESTKEAEEPALETTKASAPKKANGAKSAATPAKKSGPPAQGDVIDLSSFGGEVETHDGKKVTLKQLVDDSKNGVILFTYPKANTPGCTTQACAFRDGHETLTSTGFAIYGLSGDSPKSNTTFKTKQSLPYTLLCNPSYSLIGAIGLQQGSDKRTKRGVWAVDKQGKVLLYLAAGPLPTVDAAKKLVDEHK